MSLLMEDVLLCGFVERSVFLRSEDAPGPEVGTRCRQGSISRRMSVVTPTRSSASAAAAERKGSDASRRASDVGGTLFSCPHR